nr:phage tail protein [Paenibacillus xylanexedens]
MSSWIYVLTNKGRQLQAKAQTGVELNYTRMAVGSGTLSGQALAAMTTLITPVKSLPIIRLKHPPGATRALIGATLTNAEVQTGFYFREIGIYATDPDDGEILYMYANAGSTADYIAPIGDGVIEKDVNMNVIVGSASNVTAIINESLVYVTHDELEEALENIDVDLPDASLTVAGKVQLSNKTNGTSENLVPTEKALGLVMAEATTAKQLGNERKNEVVAALIALGVSASTSDTWSQLITKMTGVLRAKGNAIPSDVRAGKSFSNSDQADIVGTLPERTTDTMTITPGVSTKTNPPGIYGGDIIVPGEPNLLGENILINKSIFGVPGSLVPNKITEYPAQFKTLRNSTVGYSYYYESFMELNPAKRNLILFPGLSKCYTQAYSNGYPDIVYCQLAVRTQNRNVEIANTRISSASQSNIGESRSLSFNDISIDLAAKKITCLVNGTLATYTIDDPNPGYLRLMVGIAKYRYDNYAPMVESFARVQWEGIAIEY